MVLEYFDFRRGKKDKAATQDAPVLKEEDEQFLHKITSQSSPPPVADRCTVIQDDGKKVEGKDAQIALMDGADQIPLPTSPPADDEESARDSEGKAGEEEKKGRSYWSFLPALPGRGSAKGKDKSQAADDLQAAVDAVKEGEGVTDIKPQNQDTAEDKDAKKEEADLTSILDRLNLSAVNNRVFSFSQESHELMEKFTQILKDIVNGVPTAYDDLEKLLTESEGQLRKMFGSMPPFLQTLVKSLPSKMTTSLAPELLAAASEKPGVKASGVEGESSKEGDKKEKKKSKIPPLKTLVSEQGAVASMLRSILNFLKLRFPAFMTGTNVLMSLAVFLLLFVFWYCHKRGRETRLSREQHAAEGTESEMERSGSDLDESVVLEKPTEEVKDEGSDPSVRDKPSATVADQPSVLNLPDPAAAALPEGEADKGSKEMTAEANN